MSYNAGLYTEFDWDTHSDLCGSDHCPIVINSLKSYKEEQYPNWKLNKANWIKFQEECEQSINDDELNLSNPLEAFTSCLHQAAEKNIPKTVKSSFRKKPWLNDECKKYRRKRRQAQRRLEKYPTKENMKNYLQTRAKTRKLINENQKILARLC